MIIHDLSIAKKLLAFLLLAALLLSGCVPTGSEDGYALTLWYVEGEPLSPALKALAAAYNDARGRGALALTLRVFESEERLLAALQSGAAPALALLRHEAALTLGEEGLLVDVGVSPDYPDWLRERSDCVGRGFYPLGFSVPLLRCEAGGPSSLSALLDQARDGARLSVGALAPLFAQTLLDAGTEFSADFERSIQNNDYVNLYNALAEAVFDGGLLPEADAALPRALDWSTALRRQEKAGLDFYPLSEGVLFAEGWGLAVTARDARMRRALPELLRQLFEGEGLSAAALDAGLVPALPLSRSISDGLEAALLSLSGRALYLPDGASAYARDREDFEARLRAALALLR